MGPALLPAPLSPALAVISSIHFTRFQVIQREAGAGRCDA
jgi:hypothetical protein